MGACRSGGDSNAAVGNSNTLSTLRNGERSFASFSPTKLHPNGQDVIAVDNDGNYRYLGTVPNWTQIRVDTQSEDYKRAARDYNIRLTVHSDGTVTVEKGGLYDRKKTYKTRSAFLKDAEQRIDRRSSYDTNALNSKANGGLTQIEAENFKQIIRNNTSSMAIKKMRTQLQDTMQTVVTRYRAAQDAKSKLKQLSDRL